MYLLYKIPGMFCVMKSGMQKLPGKKENVYWSFYDVRGIDFVFQAGKNKKEQQTYY